MGEARGIMLTRLNRAIHGRRRKGISVKGESGQGLVEYALIIAIVLLGAIASLTFLKGTISGLFNKAGNSLAAVPVGADGSGGGGGGGGGGGPVITVTQQPTNPTTATTATFQFSSNPAATSYVCAVGGTGGSSVACTPSTNVTFNGLGTGAHTFTVTPTPAGTNGSYTWTINAAATSPPVAGTVSQISCSDSDGSLDCNDSGTATVTPGTWVAHPRRPSPINGHTTAAAAQPAIRARRVGRTSAPPRRSTSRTSTTATATTQSA